MLSKYGLYSSGERGKIVISWVLVGEEEGRMK